MINDQQLAVNDYHQSNNHTLTINDYRLPVNNYQGLLTIINDY